MKILSIKDDWIPLKLPEFIVKPLHLQSGKTGENDLCLTNKCKIKEVLAPIVQSMLNWRL